MERDRKPRNTHMACGVVALSTEWCLCASEVGLPAAALGARARGREQKMPARALSKGKTHRKKIFSIPKHERTHTHLAGT